MPNDNRVVGFSRSDAEQLVDSLGNDENWFPTRRAIPSASVRYVQFELTGSWSSGEASADFSTMDDDPIKSDTLRDPQEIASLLGSGDKGYAIQQGGKFYFVQAGCPSEDEGDPE